MGSVAVVLSALMIWLGVSTGALVVVAAAITLVVTANIHPRKIHCELYNEGAVADGKTYNFEQCKSFWIAGDSLPKAHLEIVGRFSGEAVLPLGDLDIGEVRAFLKKHLPEDEGRGEDIVDRINRIIRF